MPASVAIAPAAALANAVRSTSREANPVRRDEANSLRPALVALLKRAAQEKSKQSVVAAVWKVSESYCAEMLGGTKPLPADRIEHVREELPEVYQRFVELQAEAIGLPIGQIDPNAEALGTLLEMIGGIVRTMKPRMAKAQL